MAEQQNAIPVIDFSPFIDGNPAERKAVAAQMRQASSDWGFFYLAGCGMPEGNLREAFAASQALFALSDDAKQAVAWASGDDALLVLSNSGETTELSDMVQFSKRYKIPMIAIVGRPGSTLGESADVALVMADEPEAGTLGLAPTTSTTMTLALGDALAVALFERKQFSESDFHVFHPGGNLGQSLVRVGDIMHGAQDLPLVGSETMMSEALIVMTAKRFGCVGVIDADGDLLGIVTDGDLRRNLTDDLLERTANELMTAEPQTIRVDALAAEAVRVMTSDGMSRWSLLKVMQSIRVRAIVPKKMGHVTLPLSGRWHGVCSGKPGYLWPKTAEMNLPRGLTTGNPGID